MQAGWSITLGAKTLLIPDAVCLGTRASASTPPACKKPVHGRRATCWHACVDADLAPDKKQQSTLASEELPHVVVQGIGRVLSHCQVTLTNGDEAVSRGCKCLQGAHSARASGNAAQQHQSIALQPSAPTIRFWLGMLHVSNRYVSERGDLLLLAEPVCHEDAQ